MLTRRHLLQTTTAAGTVGFAATVPGLRAAAQAAPPLRRSLQDMDLDDPVLVTLREFVTMMKDPSREGQNVSWVGFSDIHGTLQRFNLCPHENWYFLPWHRGYLRMYEEAVRSLTGDHGFALPYWDWTAQPDFPAAFGDPIFDGRSNPLYVDGRRMRTGDRMEEGVTGEAVMRSIYDKQTLEEFGSSRVPGQDSIDPEWITRRGTQGELESNPHNNVHCDVVGPFMCTGASPQDPIFWMHHANIDRVWAKWVSEGGPDSSDPLWLTMPFTDHFYRPDGTPYTDVVGDLLDVEALGYTYGFPRPGQPRPIDPGRTLFLSALYGTPALLEFVGPVRTIERVDATAAPDDPLVVPLRSASPGLLEAASSAVPEAMPESVLGVPTIYAFVRGLVPETPDTTQVRVFVNLPEANAATQVEGNPHYVTAIGFFGPVHGRDGHGEGGINVAIDLTLAIQQIAGEGGEVGDEVTLHLVPVAQHSEDQPGAVGVEEVELAVV